MAARSPKPKRSHGSIRTLPSGSLQVRVYAGIDPVTKDELYMTEVVPVGPGQAKQADKIRTRLLDQVDEKRNPKTRATVDQLMKKYFDVLDVDVHTRRGYLSKYNIHIKPLLGTTQLTRLDVETLDTFYSELRRCRIHCRGRKKDIEHRTTQPHHCDEHEGRPAAEARAEVVPSKLSRYRLWRCRRRLAVVSWIALVGFFVAVVPLVLTPGASFTLATQRTLAGQPRATLWVVAGTATGTYIHALLAAAGLSALVMRSSEAFLVVKIVGGAYLVGLGLLTIWRTRRRREASAPGRLPWAGHHTYPQAVLANVLNPKAASIYMTLAPQFLTAQQVGVGPLLLLASVHVLAMSIWLGLWSIVLRRGRRLAQSDWFAKTVNRVGGAILVALGVRTVTS